MNVRGPHHHLSVGRIEKKETARILDHGTKVALDVKVGAKILYWKYSGTDIRIDGEEVLILHEDDVLPVFA